MSKKHMGTFSVREFALLLLTFVVVSGILSNFSGERKAVASSETRFVEHSASGLQIVPASCPSAPPHFVGDTGIPNCSVTPPSPPSSPPPVSPPPPTPPPTSQCPSGQQLVNGACVSICSTDQILVNGVCVKSCPGGQHGSGNLCICDSTNLPPDTNGQCTNNICPSGYQFDPSSGQCVIINQCSLPPICSDSLHALDQCSGNVTNCSINGPGWSCVNGVCAKAPPPIASISASPSLLSQGYTSNIAWTSQNTASCTVSGTNGDGLWPGTNGTHVSSPIQSQTIYTLSCKGIDGSTLTKTATINIIPLFEEPCATGYHRVNDQCVHD